MNILLEIGGLLVLVGGSIVTGAFTKCGENAGNDMWKAIVKCCRSFGKCFGCFGNQDVSMQTPTEGRFIPTASINETISARSMESVWAYLMNGEVTTIGVFGMGGIGKTTIMTRINNRLLTEEPSQFDKVIWVTVSKSSDVRKIQNEIAKELGHDLSEEDDVTRRKSKLYEMLSKWKRYVLILDDLWVAFSSSAEVGISATTQSNGCKLVFTTRSREVCRKMSCSTVEVELLTEDNALNLFMSVVESQTLLAPEAKVIATDVAKECKRLPLAITIIGGSMRGVNDIREWKNALTQLTSLTEKEIRDDEVDLFERLKLSYNRLQDVEIQRCFLYCALYPEDHIIRKEELIGYWIAEGLITRETNRTTREAMFDHGHTTLNKLGNNCLLQTLGDECVRMHDLIREMALKITTTGPPRFMVKAGEGLKTVPDEDWVADLEKISLMWNEIKVLPSEPPNCPQLTTLLLRGNRGLVDIPDSFFGRTPCLKVLDLSQTDIKGLPNSISSLKNLHALLLQFCENLVCLPSLEGLTALEELNLFGTGIQEVQGIEGLVSLRDLDLSRTEINPQTFPSNLRGLSQLQRLRIDDSEVRVSAEVLLSLGQLEDLRAEFNNVQELTSYAASEQCRRLKNYTLFVGIHETGTRRMAKHIFIADSKFFCRGADPLVLPSSLEFLEIERCHDLISLSDLLTLRDAKDLITCSLFDCNKIESIFSLSSSPSFLDDSLIPLKRLNELRLLYLPRFKDLFDGVVPPNGISFNLKQLFVGNCSSMKSIFPSATLLQNFPNLESLIVSDCMDVADIIGGDEAGTSNQDDSSNIITLPNLQEIRLHDLPKLKGMYMGKLVCKSLQNISVTRCPGLRRLPLSLHVVSEQAVAPPALRRISGEEEWWRSLEWDDLHTKGTLQPLFVRSSRYGPGGILWNPWTNIQSNSGLTL